MIKELFDFKSYKKDGSRWKKEYSLDEFLDIVIQAPKIQGGSGFQTIRTDFREAYEAGKIEFRDDGIYLIHEGQEWKGYMYMPTYRVSRYNSFSRFHLTRCSVIDDFIRGGMFNTYYKWSNHQKNDIEDRDTGQNYPEKPLQLCSRCVTQLINTAITDTEDFFNSLDKEEQENQDIQVDIFGYVKGKEKISKDYRTRQNYTCEKCSVKPRSNLHKRWWHTHHVDGDKTNNVLNNLKCYCIVCHSNVDARHKENFSKGSMPRQIEHFKKEYQDELKRLKNPYV